MEGKSLTPEYTKGEFATEDEVKGLVNDMRILADRIERVTKEGRMDGGTLKIIWQDFAEAKEDANTYLKD